MNENNQPQSQQTTIKEIAIARDGGSLLFEYKGIRYFFDRAINSSTRSIVFYDDVENRRSRQVPEPLQSELRESIYRQTHYKDEQIPSESSHSPTEQPGDSKWKIEYSKYSTYCNIIDADGYVGTIQGREKAELIAKAPEMAAEIERLKAECSSHEKERYEIYSFDSSQAMEIKALQKELEQLRSERDKMKEKLTNIKGIVEHLIDIAKRQGWSAAELLCKSILHKIEQSALSGVEYLPLLFCLLTIYSLMVIVIE